MMFVVFAIVAPPPPPPDGVSHVPAPLKNCVEIPDSFGRNPCAAPLAFPVVTSVKVNFVSANAASHPGLE
jgi:hypothetical protein